MVEGACSNSFMHSLLAKGRLLYTHDETIADLFAHGCAATSASATRGCSCWRRRPRRCRRIDKAHKWFVTRGDLDYTALWILYAATPLAQIEVIGRAAAGRPRSDPAGAGAEPGVLQDRSTPTCSTRRRRAKPCRRRSTPSTPISRSGRRAVRAGARPSARSRRGAIGSEIEHHFERNFGIEGVTTACEYLADQGLIGKAATPCS